MNVSRASDDLATTPKAKARGNALAALHKVLGLMVQERSRFVSRRALHEAATKAMVGQKDLTAEVLASAWQFLFPGERVIRVAAGSLKASQLPAWGWVEGQCVVVRGINATRDDYAVVDENGQLRQATGIEASTYTLLAAPPAEVQPQDAKLASRAIRAALTAHSPWLMQVGIATLVINLLSVVASLFAMQVYDRVVPNFAYSTLWVLASGVVLAMLIELLFKAARLALQERLTRRMDDGLSKFFVERLMALRMDSRPKTVGTLVAQVRDYESVRNFFTSTTLFTLADLPFALLFIGIIWMIGGPVAYAPLALIPLVLLVGFIAQRRLKFWQQQQAEESAIRSGLLFEVVDGGETIKAMAAEWRFSALWRFVTNRVAQAGLMIRTVSGNATHLSYLFQQMAYIGVIVAGVYQIEAGALSMGGLIACSILAGRALATISGVTGVLVQWQHAAYALKILNGLYAKPADDGAAQSATSTEASLGYKVEGVTYAYDPLVGANLELPKLDIAGGERIAVLGRNGSGKTTLMKLLAGLATPMAGSVRVGNIDLQQARPDWLRSSIGYLPQSPRLFAGTLRDNLVMGLSMPEETEITEAAALTGLDALIKQHPRGLDLKITEGGQGLSTGQRQLVAMTRLVLQKPKVWLLDEPASALDHEAEAKLLRFLQGLDASHTLVFITHQNHWLKLATRVLMVEGGKVVADVPADRAKIVSPEQAKSMAAAADGMGGVAA